MVSVSENKASEGKSILSEVVNTSTNLAQDIIRPQVKSANAFTADLSHNKFAAQTSMPQTKATESLKKNDEAQERERRAIVQRCNELTAKISRSTNPIEIGELIAQLNSLAAQADSLGIKINVGDIVAAANSKESSMSAMAGAAGESEKGEQIAIEAQEARAREKEWDNDPARGEWTRAKVEAAYKEFDKTNQPRLKKLRKKNKVLEDAIRAIDNGEPPSAEHIAALKPKTSEELKQERLHKEELDKIEKIAAQDYAYHDMKLKEAEERYKQLEAKHKKHIDANEHHLVAAVGKELAHCSHKTQYHAANMQQASAKQSEVKETKEEYEKEEQWMQEVSKKVETAIHTRWGQIANVNAVESRDAFDKLLDKKDLKNVVESINKEEPSSHKQVNQGDEVSASKPIALQEPKKLQPLSDFSLQQAQADKDILDSNQKNVTPSPKLKESLPLIEAKKQEQIVLSSPLELRVKGANIISSIKENATIIKQDERMHVKPEGGIDAKARKARRER